MVSGLSSRLPITIALWVGVLSHVCVAEKPSEVDGQGVVEPHRAVNDLNPGQFKHIDLSESEPYTVYTQSNSLG